MKYLVVEIQVFDNGTVSSPSWAYDTEADAIAKYHNVLAAASVSSLPVHSCIVVTDTGFQLRKECFKHPAAPSK